MEAWGRSQVAARPMGAEVSLGPELELIAVGESNGQVRAVSGTGLSARETTDCGGGGKVRGRGLGCARPTGRGRLWAAANRGSHRAPGADSARPGLRFPAGKSRRQGSVGLPACLWLCRPFSSVFVACFRVLRSLSLSLLRSSFSHAAVSET